MTTAATSLYRPLEGNKAVRFIELLPGTCSDQISVEFVYGNLEVVPPLIYDATSYTWGSEIPTHTILCDGIKFELRENAYEFMRQFVGQTVLSARQVLVWLGQQDETSSIAMEYLSQLEAAPLMREALFQIYTPGGLEPESYFFDNVLESDSSKQLVKALGILLSRAWTRRVWIQQEAGVGRDTVVYCGSDVVSLDALLALAWLLTPRQSNGWPVWTGDDYKEVEPSLLALRSIQRNRIAHFRSPKPWQDHLYDTENSLDGTPWLIITEGETWQSVTRGGLSFPFVRVGQTCSWCEAADPRDKVYAVYSLERGLTSQNLSTRPVIDYTIPWQVVYLRTAKWMYQTNHARHTLELAGRSQQVDNGIPSWVPDFRVKMDNAFVSHGFWTAGGTAYAPHIRYTNLPRPEPGHRPIPSYTYLNAKGKRKPVTREAMELAAILLDEVIYTGSKLAYNGESFQDWRKPQSQRLRSDLEVIDKSVPKYFTGESRRAAYAGAIIANTTHEDKLSTAEYEKHGFTEWQKWLESEDPSPGDPAMTYAQAVKNAVSSWNDVISVVTATAHGLMCLVPKTVENGDYVAILNGFRYPVALRKFESNDSNYYELLGRCYVHRMMRGRAWNLIEEFKVKYDPASADGLGAPDPPTMEEGLCGGFPFNPVSDYGKVRRVLGKRHVVLV